LMVADNRRPRPVHDGTAARAPWTAKDGWVAWPATTGRRSWPVDGIVGRG